MKKAVVILGFILFSFTAITFAQKPTKPQVHRDPILEADAKHNLEVAQQYFRLKKAYRAVLMRFEETYAAHPDFSKMDEFLFLAAMSSIYLAERKGNQTLIFKDEEERRKYAPEKLREDAIAYFNILKERFPKSKFLGETVKQLKRLQPQQ